MFVLFKGGRLPTWHLLTEAERTAAEQNHIDLMLSVGRAHGMRRLEGFRLMGRQHDWERFWVIEFPTLDGAEAWIEAEMAPPYGLYGYYDYQLARSWSVEHLATWPTFPRPAAALPKAIRTSGRTLGADLSSVVVLLFGRGRPGYEAVSAETRGDEEHVGWMQQVASRSPDDPDRGVPADGPDRRLAPRVGHRIPDLAGAEAWMTTEVLPPHGAYFEQGVPPRAALVARLLRDLGSALGTEPRSERVSWSVVLGLRRGGTCGRARRSG